MTKHDSLYSGMLFNYCSKTYIFVTYSIKAIVLKLKTHYIK